MMIKEFIGKILAGERDGTTLWKIPICEIEYQPITDPAEGVLIASLAENILRCGLLQPILLYREKQYPLASHSYRLISGRRRLEAIRMLGRTHIDGIVVRCKPEQITALSLSDNLLCREPDILRLASQIRCLLDGGMDIDRLSSLLAIPVEQLQIYVDLLMWPPEDLRLLQLSGASRGDLQQLVRLSPLNRRFALEKMCNVPSDSLAPDTVVSADSIDVSSARVEKIAVCDPRLFSNTIERAVDLMKKSGYDATIDPVNDDAFFTYHIRVAKLPGVSLVDSKSDNVSRETFLSNGFRSRFSVASNIFEAIAEEERNLAENVSRETSTEGQNVDKDEEFMEKLELCIDETA